MIRHQMVRFLGLVLGALLLSGCVSEKNVGQNYPTRPADTSGRKAGAAMLLYEQAEEDLDVNSNVTVIPPDKEKKQ
jgi:hypothetical protein